MVWRHRVLTLVLAAGWIVLAGRLVEIQLLHRRNHSDRAQRQQVLEETIPARPGDILDRHGRLLAVATRADSLYVDPSALEAPADVADRIAPLLGLDARQLRERFERAADRRFLWVKRRLSPREVEDVRALELPPGCWGFRQEYRRHYPQGALAAHVLGLRDADGVGRGGVEQWCDARLRGRDGRRRLLRDARGFVLDVVDEVAEPAIAGESIVLTLDSLVQLFVERELDALLARWQPVSACAIVLDPQTGDVLAMASRPAFDPNRPDDVPDDAWLNTAVAATFEPGSTFKPCVVAWALDHERLTPDEQFDCERGTYRMRGRVLHDHHPYGPLDVAGILVKSSNIGMAKIGERLGNAGLYDAAAAFGFGRRTGIELPGELAGTLRPLKDWTAYSTGSIPMGQELAATPLQVLAAFAALANRGRWISPHLLQAPASRPDASNVVSSTVVSEATARWIVETALVDVVERGTGQSARIKGLRVFGKSGTAQKIDPQTGEYSPTRHVSSFACGAPAERPRAVVLVSVNEPTGPNYFGGTVAGAAAARILQHTLMHLDDRSQMTAAPPPDRR